MRKVKGLFCSVLLTIFFLSIVIQGNDISAELSMKKKSEITIITSTLILGDTEFLIIRKDSIAIVINLTESISGLELHGIISIVK